MPPVNPPGAMHTTQDLVDRLVIEIPSPKVWPPLALQLLGILPWLVVELATISALMIYGTRLDHLTRLFGLGWLVFWTAGEIFPIYGFVSRVAGKERLDVTSGRLALRQTVLGIGSLKEFSVADIKRLRVSAMTMSTDNPVWAWAYMYRAWQGNMGALAFDYRTRIFKFGLGLDETEAGQILAEIQQKFPQYRDSALHAA